MTNEKTPHEKRSLDYFLRIYRGMDPADIVSRCALTFDGEAFPIRIMGKEYRVAFPDFSLVDADEIEIESGYEKI